MSAIYMLWLREVKRYSRSRAQIVASLGQPLLYLLALGFGMGPIFQKAGQGSYLQFVAPGVIAMTVLFTSVFSGIGLLWDRQFGFLKETLVAPGAAHSDHDRPHARRRQPSRWSRECSCSVVCFVAGFRIVNFAAVPLAFLFMALIAIVFAALGTAIGSLLENMQGFQLIMNFLVMPIFFLSGALYPLNNLPRMFHLVTSVDPLAYGVDGLRGTLIGTSYFGVGVDLVVLSLVGTVFVLCGTRAFSKIQI